ncbi:Sec-independent protein translocase subunit TatA [Actinocrinis puniceicyclus]|uniref:Sec-independent protein translocase protein TatA n=1 Tax=Actinocrinis puniceicyclus TaxID=977794 RepID=A0A8J7WHZ0_9ACTN|nr:Sec-independent protein translocase subunit TatA [Actinocrinis puniceicyclus]MBS2962501.1 Sec-independent protein translocase subunit TatA [Actinocrinis puniceicyclus]
MLRGLEGWHIVIIVALVVLLFGSRKLPDAARSVGQSLRIFKSEMKAAAKDGDAPEGKKVDGMQQAVEGKTVTPTVNDSVPHNTGVTQP